MCWTDDVVGIKVLEVEDEEGIGETRAREYMCFDFSKILI